MSRQWEWLRQQLKRKLRLLEMDKETDNLQSRALETEYLLDHSQKSGQQEKEALITRQAKLRNALQQLEEERNTCLTDHWSSLISELYSLRRELDSHVFLKLEGLLRFMQETEVLMESLDSTLYELDHKECRVVTSGIRGGSSLQTFYQWGPLKAEGEILQEKLERYRIVLHQFNQEGHLDFRLRMRRVEFSSLKQPEEIPLIQQTLKQTAIDCEHLKNELKDFLFTLLPLAVNFLEFQDPAADSCQTHGRLV